MPDRPLFLLMKLAPPHKGEKYPPRAHGDSADSLASLRQIRPLFLAFDVFYDKLPKPIDRRDRIDVTLALRLAPRKKSMPPPKTIPSQPGFAAVARLSIIPNSNPGRCHGNQINLCPKRSLNSSIFSAPFAAAASAIPQSGCKWSICAKRQKAMQRRVDRRRYGIVPERTERVHPDHLVFMLNAAIPPLSACNFSRYSAANPLRWSASNIATAAFYPKDSPARTIERVHFLNFRTGISTSEIRNNEDRNLASSNRVPQQQLRRIQRLRHFFIPPVFQIAQTSRQGFPR